MGHDDVAFVRAQLLDDLCLLAAVDQAVVLYHQVEQRRVGIQVGVVRVPRHSGVDDHGAGGTSSVLQLSDNADDVALGGLGGEERPEGPGGDDNVALHVYRDDDGGGRVQVHDRSPRCATGSGPFH